MSDDILTRLRAEVCWCYDGETCVTCEAANWIELYRNIIWHLWAHRHGCGRQDCALCTEAYRAFTEENERMIDDE